MCHFNGYNMWLLKPTHLNRGRGIHVFRDLDTLHKLIREYCNGKDEEVKTMKKDPNGSPTKDGKGDIRISSNNPKDFDESGNME